MKTSVAHFALTHNIMSKGYLDLQNLHQDENLSPNSGCLKDFVNIHYRANNLFAFGGLLTYLMVSQRMSYFI